jgi:hypothetical protein
MFKPMEIVGNVVGREVTVHGKKAVDGEGTGDYDQP